MNDENLIPAKKGEVRNPKGKQKGTKNFKTIYKKYLELKLKPSESGFNIPFTEDDKPISIKEMIILRHLKKALGKSGYKDIEMIINRVDGLLKQNIDIDNQITINDAKKIADEILKDEQS